MPSATLSQDFNSIDGINLKWSFSSFGTVREITLIYYKNITNTTINSLDVSTSSSTINLNLDAGSFYSFQIQASDGSNTVYSNILILQAPYILLPPVIESYVGRDNALEITLEPTTNDLTGADFVEFLLIKPDNSIFWIIKNYSGTNIYTLSNADNNNLVNDVDYRVACIFQPDASNTKYTSPSDISLTLSMTPSNTPNQVVGTSLTTSGFTTLQLTANWTKPTDFNEWSSNFSIVLQLINSSDTVVRTETLTTDVETYDFLNLPRDEETYNFKIYYVNSFGNGKVSDDLEVFVKPISISDAPILDSIIEGDTQVQISWSNPAFVGQTFIVNYKVYQDNVFVADVPNDTMQYTFTGLTNGISYNFSVKIENSVGLSPFSNTIQGIPYGDISFVSSTSTNKTVQGVINPNGRAITSLFIFAYDTNPNNEEDGKLFYEFTQPELDLINTTVSSNINISHTFSAFTSAISYYFILAHTNTSHAYITSA
jgi:hypothetical protein